MKKYLLGFLFVFLVSVLITSQYEKYADDSTAPGQNSSGPTVSPSNSPKPAGNPQQPQDYPPRWLVVFYQLFGWPNGITVWALFFTMMAIVEQTRHTAEAARAAKKSADAALLNTQAFISAERPWILVKAEPSKRRQFGWELIAVNKGRTPAKVVAQADNCIALDVMASLPDIAKYGKTNIYPAPQIILPDEPFVIGEITQYSLFKNDQGSITRFRNVETQGYVYGSIVYHDLLSPASAEPHETRWCFSILPWQDQGMLLHEHGWGGNEYIRHT